METQFPLLIIVMVLATQISRLSPVFFLSNHQASPRFEQWLKHVAIAVLVALIVPEFFARNSSHIVDPNIVFCLAGAFALLVGLKTKNLIVTTIAGVVTTALARKWLGL